MKILDIFVPTKRNKFKAHLLRMESLVVITLIVFITNLFISNLPISEVQAKMDVNSIIYFHNRERVKRALSQFVINSKLIESATSKAKVMLELDCWDHYCPEGVSPWEEFKKVDYKYSFAGENLAEGFGDNAVMMEAWMNSPTHRENILKPEFTEIGIGQVEGTFQGKKDNLIVAVHFGHPLETISIPESKKQEVSNNPMSIGMVVLDDSINQGYFNDNYLKISGKTDESVIYIKLIVNNKVVEEIKTTENEFIFNKNKVFKFPDGKNIVRIQAFNENDEQIFITNETHFFIDTISPTFNLEEIEINEIIEDQNIDLSIEVPTDSVIKDAYMLIENTKILGNVLGSSARYDINFDLVKTANEIIFVVEDKAGNVASTKNIKSLIIDSTNKKLENLGISESIVPVLGQLNILKPKFEFNTSVFNLKTTFNLIIVAIIIALLTIDYAVIKKYHLIDLDRLGHHHIKIALLFVIGFIAMLSSGYGHILTGSSI